MASGKARHSVGLGLLGSGVVGEAIQDIVFADLEGQVGVLLQRPVEPAEPCWSHKHHHVAYLLNIFNTFESERQRARGLPNDPNGVT